MIIEEKLFHKNRIAFAIVRKSVLYLKNSELGHKEWLVDSGILTQEEFNNITRGFVKDSDIYFYKGDFKTDKQVEDEAKKYTDSICVDLNINIPNCIYCGMNKGKIGEKWTPIKRIKTR